LSARVLQVQSPQDPPARTGQVVLDESWADAVFGIPALGVGLAEEASRVAVNPGFDDHHPGQPGLHDVHCPAPASSSKRSRYCPYSVLESSPACTASCSASIQPFLNAISLG